MATYAPRAQAPYRRSAKYDDKDYRQEPFQPPHQPQHQRAAPPVPPKDDAPAPLPRQNSKTVPPSPPRVIRDTSKGATFTRIGFLGEGGFARVYEVADLRGERSAVKVVTKSSLKTKKSKTKLFAEIKLHGSLLHPNIVGFEGCFEDTEYVYMKLELCQNGSMMDMLRQRRRFLEPEARFYLVQEEDEVAAVLAKEERNRTRELESQKARIVAQMAPEGEDAGKAGGAGRRDDDDDERENVPPAGQVRDRRKEEDERERDRRRREREREREREKEREREREREKIREQQRRKAAGVPASTKQAIPQSSKGPVTTDEAAAGSLTNPGASGKLHGFEQVAETLARAFEDKDKGRLFRDPRNDVDLDYEHVFIVSWVDYCNKYGMGYALTDGTIGVHFNDSTTLLLSPNKENLDYISSRRTGSVYVRKHFGVAADQHPEELTSKVYLLKHFEAYMMERLYGNHSFCWDDTDRTEGMDFVQKYFRMKNVIVFKLSNEAIQFNFYDHTKMILSAKGHGITYLDKHYRKTHHSLSELMQRALSPSTNEQQRKAEEKLLNKLKYCKEVLLSIKTIGSSTTTPDES
ncbi:Cell cycle serine/threonine-protein kinase cdc5/MSD2 [Tulasnella sp. 417]|nr:Cell cycle serine/threonine-protein kinase cdc5/MSD2 [Tulasnella sp. 417]